MVAYVVSFHEMLRVIEDSSYRVILSCLIKLFADLEVILETSDKINKIGRSQDNLASFQVNREISIFLW